MTNNDWEQTLHDKKNGGFMTTLVQILTLGIAEKPEFWEVEYKNKQSGEKVRAVGSTIVEAERNAQRAINLAG